MGKDGIIYEGEFNRAIVNGIIEQLTKFNIPYVNIAPEYRDVRLETRVRRANKYPVKSSFYLSVHSNAGGGKGSEIFTSPGNTKSDKIATAFFSKNLANRLSILYLNLFYKPKTPVQFFTEKSEAQSWLKQIPIPTQIEA